MTTRPHLQVRDFSPEILKAAEKLFDAGPWKEDGKQHSKFNTFLAEATASAGLESPPIYRVTRSVFWHLLDYCCISDNTIVYPKYSVLTLFHGTHHILSDAADPIAMPDEMAAQGFALSLFYRVRPKLFRRSVRRGIIESVYPEHLIRPEAPISLCKHCSENVWETRGGRWRHVNTGHLHCIDAETVAAPSRQEAL